MTPNFPHRGRGRGRGRGRDVSAGGSSPLPFRRTWTASLLALLLGTAVSLPAFAGEPQPAEAPSVGGVAAEAVPLAASAGADEVPLPELYREGGSIGRQSSNAHVVLFWVGAVAALLGAIAVIVARRPMRSALGLLVVVLATAGMYLLLRAELLAALQVLIYAGAVVVLLVFVITFLDQGALTAPGGRRLPIRVLAAAALIWAFYYLVGHEVLLLGLGSLVPPPPEFGSTASVGHALFTTYLIPFEALSALLLTAIVGAVAVAKGGTGDGGAPTTTTTMGRMGGGE